MIDMLTTLIKGQLPYLEPFAQQLVAQAIIGDLSFAVFMALLCVSTLSLSRYLFKRGTALRSEDMRAGAWFALAGGFVAGGISFAMVSSALSIYHAPHAYLARRVLGMLATFMGGAS